MAQPESTQITDSIRQTLHDVAGVDRVFVDEERHEVWLVLRPNANAGHVEDDARSLVGPDYRVIAAFPAEHRDRQRVRFLSLSREQGREQHINFTTVLEWNGTHYPGTAVGDKGDAVELRTAALSSLAAVAAIVPGDLHIKLAGVKQVRAFDADLIVVSLYRSDVAPHNLVGAVVAGEDPRRAAATAVLAALNRLLGNYLALP